MNIIVLCITRFLMELSSMSVFAESFDSGAMTAAASSHGVQPVASLQHRSGGLGSLLTSDPSSEVTAALRDRVTRTKELSVGMFRTGVFTEDDRAALTLCAPTRGMNRALSLIRTVSGVRLNESLVSWVQGLSAVTKRQVNAEFNYSSRIDKRSELNSSLAYRLNPDNYAGKSDVIATVRYSTNF